MKNTKIIRLKKDAVVEVLEEDFYLPEQLKMDINEYWKKLISQNPRYTRGKIFCVKEVVEENDIMKITLTNSE